LTLLQRNEEEEARDRHLLRSLSRSLRIPLEKFGVQGVDSETKKNQPQKQPGCGKGREEDTRRGERGVWDLVVLTYARIGTWLVVLSLLLYLLDPDVSLLNLTSIPLLSALLHVLTRGAPPMKPSKNTLEDLSPPPPPPPPPHGGDTYFLPPNFGQEQGVYYRLTGDEEEVEESENEDCKEGMQRGGRGWEGREGGGEAGTTPPLSLVSPLSSSSHAWSHHCASIFSPCGVARVPILRVLWLIALVNSAIFTLRYAFQFKVLSDAVSTVYQSLWNGRLAEWLPLEVKKKKLREREREGEREREREGERFYFYLFIDSLSTPY